MRVENVLHLGKRDAVLLGDRALRSVKNRGALLVKVAERKATLLGLNASIGHAVRVVQHAPEQRETSTDKIERALAALIEDGKRTQSRNGQGEPH
jgi:hypothetical protein